jgi:excisionase family DNA binding protein
MQFYTVAEVAIILETKVGLVHVWIQEGMLPAVQFGSEQHTLRIRAQNLENFIDTHFRSGLIKTDHQ